MLHDITAPRAAAAAAAADGASANSAHRALVRLYGVAAYATFLATIGYFWLFLADILVPTTVDRGASPLGPALAVDLSVLLLFGLQHSIMARASFKGRLSRLLPPSMERSTFVLVSGLMLVLLFWLWQPVPALVWRVGGTAAVSLRAVFCLGIALAVGSTFAISHAELFGLLQSRVFPGAASDVAGLRMPLLYRLVRHPMHLGMLATLWATPRMTAGHLLFALAMSIYVLIGIRFEERDLVRRFGDAYRAYRRRTPALLFILRPSWPRAVRASLLAVGAALAATGATWSRPSVRLPEAAPPAPLARDTVVVGGRARSFDLYVPPDIRAGAPIIVVLHGTGGSGRRLRTFLGGELERLAARHGFVVAYPQALGGAWNSCRTRPGAAASAGVDDVAMVRAVTGRVARLAGADAARVFAMGYSGGGHLAYRLALEAPDAIAGTVVIGANLSAEGYSVCRPAGAAVPMLIVNGTEDLVNPFHGGPATSPFGVPLGRVRSAEETGAYFGALAGARTRQAPAVVVRDDAGDPIVERVKWAGGAAEVALYTVHGGGHTVPGPARRMPSLLGVTEPRWSALEEAISFFGLNEAPRP